MTIVQLPDLLKGLHSLRLGKVPVIVHASLKSFGWVAGGARTVVSALAAVYETVITPTFTYKTMITPLTGPENNGITYGSGADQNRLAEFFTPDLPADPLMGVIPETLRRHPRARRSSHPIQSFAGIRADKFLQAQTRLDPLAPIGMLEKAGGWALLIGVDHTVNTSIHYAEKLAGRPAFIRWALTPAGIVECPGFPGCSAGFQAIAPDLERLTRCVWIGEALVQAIPLKRLFQAVIARIRDDPLALLCTHENCERSDQIRALVQATR